MSRNVVRSETKAHRQPRSFRNILRKLPCFGSASHKVTSPKDDRRDDSSSASASDAPASEKSGQVETVQGVQSLAVPQASQHSRALDSDARSRSRDPLAVNPGASNLSHLQRGGVTEQPSISTSSGTATYPVAKVQASAPCFNSFSDGDFGDSGYGYDGGCDGGCFLGSCTVLMANGSTKAVRTLEKGDLVRCSDKDTGVAEVLCLVIVRVPTGVIEVCQLGNLSITKGHPVVAPGSGKWCFPRDITSPSHVEATEMYNVLLADPAQEHTLFVNGVRCVALGFNRLPAEMYHSFYCEWHRVVDELRRCDDEGLGKGQVEINGLKRRNGKVYGFREIENQPCKEMIFWNGYQQKRITPLLGQTISNEECLAKAC